MQNLGSCSTGQEQCTSEPFVKNKGRVSSWRWYPVFCAIWRILGQSLRTQEKGQVLTYRGFLSDGGMVYSAQIDLKVGDSFEGDSFEKELSNGPEHRM